MEIAIRSSNSRVETFRSLLSLSKIFYYEKQREWAPLPSTSLRRCCLRAAAGCCCRERLLQLGFWAAAFENLRNWSEATSFCIWTGITCGKKHTDRVAAINLSNMGLEGNIAKEIGNLSFLRYIDISNNSINGLIPGEIGNLRRLRVLRMAFNQLSGGIPPSLGSLRKLQGVNQTFDLGGSKKFLT
ncbi:LRR receptor-like serine/threonine-protein kinase EFR [Salvia miltiorrhiza]|uniref:LRR receptor-like serine/threonine-protein kinase EFR n=1 Tax=Salvia miltiorrhiza TaxID=226208 RepID=UPI0025ABD3C5|nr:LRR receptor-like serine/threonine-protein kinase EFR [Salvia miltiorrhiza]